LLQLFFSFVCIVLLNILSVYYSTLTSYMNLTILQEYGGNDLDTQAVDASLLPHGLDTKQNILYL